MSHIIQQKQDDLWSLGMNNKVQRFATIFGPLAMIMFLVGFIIAGFLIPPYPTRGVQETVAALNSNAAAIRIGLLIICLSGGVYVLFSTVISIQMSRIEGRHNVLSLFQFGMAVLTGFIVIFPCYYWFFAIFRPRSPELVLLLNDMGWITFGGFIWTIFWQYLAIALAIFLDKHPQPIFPRWFGYFTISAAICVLPGGFNACFLQGPMAWNGWISWWLEVTVIAIWSYTTCFVLLGVLKRQESDAMTMEEQKAIEIAAEEALIKHVSRLENQLLEISATSPKK